MADANGDTDSRIQRDLGYIAAMAEEGRRGAEAALLAERARLKKTEQRALELESRLAAAEKRSASAEAARLESTTSADKAGREAVARQMSLQSEISGLLQKLTQEQETAASLQAEVQAVWKQLAIEQEGSAALREELQGARRQLAQAQDYAKRTVSLQGQVKGLQKELEEAQQNLDQNEHLQAELERLRLELVNEQKAAAEATALRAEVCQLRQDLDDMRATIQLKDGAEGEESAQAQVFKLKRELRGMKVVTGALERKVQTYEQRLLEHSRTCADELNSMHPGAEGEPGGGDGQDEQEDAIDVLQRFSISIDGGKALNTLLSGFPNRRRVDGHADMASPELKARGPS